MPIYAFECDTCGHQFERLQRLSDVDPSQCPDCSAETVRRQLTAPSFRLAGAGWYETDFKKDGDKKRNLAERAERAERADVGAGDAAAATKSEAKSEAKPEAKPAPATEVKPKAAAPTPVAAKPDAKGAAKPTD